MQIGTIANYYGNLKAEERDGKFFWAIENWDGCHWEEITEDLYRELVKFEGRLGDKRKKIREKMEELYLYQRSMEKMASEVERLIDDSSDGEELDEYYRELDAIEDTLSETAYNLNMYVNELEELR